MRRPLIVECFGMPAAGKSRVARSLVAMLRREGLSANDYALIVSTRARPHRVLTKARLIFAAAPLWLSHLPSMLRSSRRIHWRSSHGTVTALFNWLYIISLLRRTLSEESISVLDQGICQALWSINYRSVDRKPGRRGFLQAWLDEALDLLDRPAMILLVVEADEARVRERLRTRSDGASPLDEGGENRWRAARLSTARVLDVIRLTERTCDDFRVVVFENNEENDLNTGLEVRLGRQLLPMIVDLKCGTQNI